MNPLSLRHLARRIRHAPGLRRAEWLWSVLCPAYWRLLDPLGNGVPIRLGGKLVRLPAALMSTNPDWSHYETESFSALAAWLDAHPQRATLLDLGCSFGVVTSFAVQTHPQLEAIAIDSDLVSLRALEAIVPRAALPRVRRVEGLLDTADAAGQSLDAAVVATLRRLPELPPSTAITRACFRCLGGAGTGAIPVRSLDSLLRDAELPGPMLLKCDVEGAELLVLRGGEAIIARHRPTLLLSVHPQALPQFGHTVEDVAAWLAAQGYRWRLLARDHEEHWLAEPAS